MPSSGSRDHGRSKPKRRSLFGLSSLTQINSNAGVGEQIPEEPVHTLRKRRTPSVSTVQESTTRPSQDLPPSSASLNSSPIKPRRPSISIRPGAHRPGSVFGSLRSMRSSGGGGGGGGGGGDEDVQLSATSTKSSSFGFGDTENLNPMAKTVLRHGEVQTSSNMFRKKKEYLVLTDTHIVRCKSQGKASDVFPTIPPPFGRSPTVRHSSSQSLGSSHDLQSLASDSSGDKEGRISLRQVVAVHRMDDGKPYFAIEICYLDEDSNQAGAMTLQLSHPDDRDGWLRSIRAAATAMRLRDVHPIAPHSANYAARTVERESDYDPARFTMYKVVQKQSPKASSRSSTDDLAKISSIVCFLAIGIHKLHLIPLAKGSSRTSTTSLAQNLHGSHGILTLAGVRMSAIDDNFELTFRQPLKRPKTLYLSSLASQDIAVHLHHVENYLRPECAHRLFNFIVPPRVEDQVLPPVDSSIEEHSCLDRTLTAYCIAYGINPAVIRYTINYQCEDAPRFELLPLAEGRRRDYHPIELLAVMRALRYNETFGSVSFADVRLDSLNGLHDHYGAEYVCSQTKRGTPIRLTFAELGQSSILVQEIRALAATNKKLRRLDFSGCIVSKPPDTFDDTETRSRDIGCGIVEALFPLCKHQTTNVDWISLNGIILSEVDLDYLVGAAVDRSCHFRALELSRCGLNDRTLGLVLDALRAQDNTLEALDISGNLARLSPAVFDSQISVFGFIRYLNLSFLSRTSGPEPLLTADTLLTWRLEELRLSGTSVNEKTVEALATYLGSSQSDTLHELLLDHALLTGSEIATLMQAMHRRPDQARSLHLDISHNNIAKDHEALVNAIEAGHSPTHVTLRAMEYRDEIILRHLINALRQNHSTRYLDISRASLPGDASEETSTALERLFADNDTLEELDISGEDSRLETSKFGAGLNRALAGLKSNTHLQVLRIEYQKLGFSGASILADALKENTTLREVYCEHNDIPLHAFTDMVNALHKNTTLIYLPLMDEGRALALKQTERQVKQIRDEAPLSSHASPPSPSSSKSPSFGVRRGLASVKRNVTLRSTSSSYTPSFPSLPPSNLSSSLSAEPQIRPAARSYSLPPNASSTSIAAAPKSRLAQPSAPTAAPLPQLSEQDIQAALRLVAESWDRQQYRLKQYLRRNWCLLQGLPTDMEIEEEMFERPDDDLDLLSASSGPASLGRMLERVRGDRTPREEKGDMLGDVVPGIATTTANNAGLGGAGGEMFNAGMATYQPLRPRGDSESTARLSVRKSSRAAGDDVYADYLAWSPEMVPDDEERGGAAIAGIVDKSHSSTDEEEEEDEGDDGEVLEIRGLGIRDDGELRTPTRKNFPDL